MSLINISKLTFAYEGSIDNVFTDVSFSIDTDWKLGFCGRNGRGKTTFLKLLMGKYEYSGSILASGIKFDYFPIKVDKADRDGNTLDILEKTAPSAQPWQIQKELFKLDIDDGVLYRPFNTLSGGEQTKVLLAGLFLRQNNFLLIDEPTNHLDMAARQKVAQYLKSKSGFILVSHDRTFLDDCTDHILSINKNDIEIISGNFSTWIEQKDRRDALETAQNQRLEQEIGRLKRAATQTAEWSDRAEKGKYGTLNSGLKVDRGYVGHKAAKMMKRSKVIEQRQNQAIEDKSKLLKNLETAWNLKISPLRYHSECLLTLSGVNLCCNNKQVLKDFDLTLLQGQRIALSGANGSGKSSVIKIICGNLQSDSGRVNIGSRLVISHIPQDASFLAGNLSEYANQQQIDQTLFKSILHKLDFSKSQFEKDMREFSAGQKKKVLLAASLCKHAHVYVWDEPLNYIDALSRIQIEDLILAHNPTMIFAEHDKAFCDKIATDIIKL